LIKEAEYQPDVINPHNVLLYYNSLFTFSFGALFFVEQIMHSATAATVATFWMSIRIKHLNVKAVGDLLLCIQMFETVTFAVS